MLPENVKSRLVQKLKKEDKHGLAYCIDHMKPANTSFCTVFFDYYTKKELQAKIADLTDDELARLYDFQVYRPLFNLENDAK